MPKLNLFQSTLPRRERLAPVMHGWWNADISIHAPAKGATFMMGMSSSEVDISIHAPAKGATLFCAVSPLFAVFQSTLPRRERPNTPRKFPSFLNFNPRSREGSDFTPLF